MKWRQALTRPWFVAPILVIATAVLQMQLMIEKIVAGTSTSRHFLFNAYVVGPLWILSAAFAVAAFATTPGRYPTLWTIAIVYLGMLVLLILPPMASLDAQRGLAIAAASTVGCFVALAGVALAAIIFSTVNTWEGDQWK